MHNFGFMRVQSFEIPKSVNESILVQVDKSKVFFKHLHQHGEIQLSYIVEGQGKLIVANSIHRFSSGDFFVIAGGTPHLFQSEENSHSSHMISLFFTANSFGNGFVEIPELAQMRRFLEISENGLELISQKDVAKTLMVNLSKTKGLDKFINFLKLIQLLNNAETASLASFSHSKKISNEEGRRMRLAFDYAMSNFSHDIKLNHVADLVHMTPNAFCRFFKQRTNKTYFDFVIELRIEHSCQMALNSKSLSIAEIAESSGFGSISNFNRKFKKLKGLTPTEYRNNNTLGMPF